MKGKNIFQKKKEFDLESAVKLSEVKGETVELNDFEIYTSRKYRTDFAVIETGEGNLYMTWGQVVVQKLEELKELPADFSERG